MTRHTVSVGLQRAVVSPGSLLVTQTPQPHLRAAASVGVLTKPQGLRCTLERKWLWSTAAIPSPDDNGITWRSFKTTTSGDSDLIGLGGVQALLYLKALQLIQIYIIARIELSYCYSRAGHLICPPPASSSPGPGQYEP